MKFNGLDALLNMVNDVCMQCVAKAWVITVPTDLHLWGGGGGSPWTRHIGVKFILVEIDYSTFAELSGN